MHARTRLGQRGFCLGGSVLLGYARVSKGDDQNNALQTKALRAAGCRRIFEEAASGGRWDRPELHRLLGRRYRIYRPTKEKLADTSISNEFGLAPPPKSFLGVQVCKGDDLRR